jgi:hypothetical protein
MDIGRNEKPAGTAVVRIIADDTKLPLLIFGKGKAKRVEPTHLRNIKEHGGSHSVNR